MVLVERIAMTTDFSEHKMMAWLSPAYPIGSYSFSHGLEQAIESKIVSDKESLFDWLSQILAFGSGRNDAIFLANAYRSSKENLLTKTIKQKAKIKILYPRTRPLLFVF